VVNVATDHQIEWKIDLKFSGWASFSKKYIPTAEKYSKNTQATEKIINSFFTSMKAYPPLIWSAKFPYLQRLTDFCYSCILGAIIN